MPAIESFLNFYNTVEPIIDILVTTIILYAAYQIIVKTNAMQIVRAGLIILVVYVIAYILRLNVMMWILSKIAPALAVCLAIVFQPEIRKLILKLGQGDWRFFVKSKKYTFIEEVEMSIDEVVLAAESLSKIKKGMLVVFERNTKLDNFMKIGTVLNANVSTALLLTIFSYETPIHDGACVVKDGKILAAGCFLPLSERFDLKKTYGTRHRAAIGMAEQTDAVILVVSEETGAISLAYGADFDYDLKREQLRASLRKLLNIKNRIKNIDDN